MLSGCPPHPVQRDFRAARVASPRGRTCHPRDRRDFIISRCNAKCDHKHHIASAQDRMSKVASEQDGSTSRCPTQTGVPEDTRSSKQACSSAPSWPKTRSPRPSRSASSSKSPKKCQGRRKERKEGKKAKFKVAMASASQVPASQSSSLVGLQVHFLLEALRRSPKSSKQRRA